MRYDPKWASTRRPKGRAARWEQRPKWEQRSAAQESEGHNVVAAAVGLEDPAWAQPPGNRFERARAAFDARARALWGTPDQYREQLRLEALEDPELYLAVQATLAGRQRSTYRAQLRDERLIERYDAKEQKQVRDTVAVLRRRRSQLIVPFSIDARNISYFNQRVPERVWNDQQKGLRIGTRR